MFDYVCHCGFLVTYSFRISAFHLGLHITSEKRHISPLFPTFCKNICLYLIAETKNVCTGTQNKEVYFMWICVLISLGCCAGDKDLCAWIIKLAKSQRIKDLLSSWLQFQAFAYSLHVWLFWTEYCMDHWKEDWFFGYQCLNGSNPRMITRCTKLPENFPVTPDMVQRSMAPKTNLDVELKVEMFLKCTFPHLLSE